MQSHVFEVHGSDGYNLNPGGSGSLGVGGENPVEVERGIETKNVEYYSEAVSRVRSRISILI